MITTLNKLNPQHDYAKDNRYIVFYHNDKPTSTKEIKADWFDLNVGDKVDWLLVREYDPFKKVHNKYRNIKLKNIDQTAEIVVIN